MKKILGIFVALMIVIGIAGAGTFASFVDTETSANNRFDAGTLNLELTGGTDHVDSVSANWVSPADWKPGDIVGDMGVGPAGRIVLHNSGTIHARYLKFTFRSTVDEGSNPESEVAGGDLRDQILVTELRIGVGSQYAGWNVVGTVAAARGDNLLPLTLRELTELHITGPLAGQPRRIKIRGSTAIGMAGILAGGHSNIQMTFQLANTAGNQFQGDIATLEVEILADQNPVWPVPGSDSIEISPIY